MTALHAGTLPVNVRVHEFYLQSGAMLGVPEIQRNYICLNHACCATCTGRPERVRRSSRCATKAGGAATARRRTSTSPPTMDQVAASGMAGRRSSPLSTGPAVHRQRCRDERRIDVILDDAGSWYTPPAPARTRGDAEFAPGLHEHARA